MSQAVLLEQGSAGRAAWLSKPTLLLCIAGIVLPNALSLGALILGIGSPPRTTAILCYAVVAVIARFASAKIVVPLFLATLIYDAIATIALLFNLAPSEIGLALSLAGELQFWKSPLYIALTGGLLAVAGANIGALMFWRDALRRGSIASLLLFALTFAAADFYANTSAHYEFGTLYGANQPVTSAVDGSGFRDRLTTATPPRALFVLVEAMGQFADVKKRALLLQAFRNPELLKRYDVTFGSSTYYGSTTAAEMRELCHTRESYTDFAAGTAIDCLPKELRARGYRTVSLHNFTSAFFGRSYWYPKLGFETSLFTQDFRDRNFRICGGPFRGPCDTEMVPVIARELREAKQPIFYYWLTLSTHVPVAPNEGTPRLDCDRDGGVIGHREVCHMTELWLDLFDAVAKMALELPPTEILITGDHAPPLWSKAGRALFLPGQVPWIRLTPRAAVADNVR